MFERFTERARQVVVLAQEEARTFKHTYIGTEHILLGLLREEEGAAARVLEDCGITTERVRGQLVRIAGVGEENVSGQIPFTPRAKRTLELALREALGLATPYVDTEHLLLGLLRLINDDKDDDNTRLVLEGFRVEPADIRSRLLRSLGLPPDEPDPRSPWDATAKKRVPRSDPEPASSEPPLGLEAVPTHTDRPAIQDGLGRARLAEVLAERVRRVRGEDTERQVENWREARRKLQADRKAAREAGSFMIHIHAPWGAGKSSLLNFLAAELRNSAVVDEGPVRARIRRAFGRRRPASPGLSRWIVVEFNAWEHQRLAPPWWWLLAAIKRSCGRELWRISRPRWALFWLRDLGWRLWNSRVAWLSVSLVVALVVIAKALHWFGVQNSSLSAVKATAVSVSLILAAGTGLWGRIHGTSRWLAVGSAEGAAKFLKRAHDPLEVYRRRIRWLVRSSGSPIAVFIDDLDRCKPEYVVELLEGVQTLFAGEPVTFVVAADRTWLCESFATVYSEFRDAVGDVGRPLGFLFLEKTFQVSMEVPPMSYKDRQHYWRALTSSVEDVGKVKEARSDVATAFGHARTHAQVDQQIRKLIHDGANKDDVLRAAVRKLNAPSLQAQLEDLLREFAVLLENNPRSMKRLVNAYGIERDRLLREEALPSPEDRKRLVLFTILRLRWPLLADHLLKHPEDVGFFGSQKSPDGHPFAPLFRDRELCALFDGSCVTVTLDSGTLTRYAGRDGVQPSTVGA